MYDFRALSSLDFELLVRDLLQSELGILLESFKPGKDSGIDLRHVLGGQSVQMIVQCKHYAVSGLQLLLRSIKEERQKVDALKPARYLIATSVSLSPDNKKSIRGLLGQHCTSEQDIFGLEDLNNLLIRHPDIETAHYKLWLSSTAVLQKILHSGVCNQTESLLERIRHDIRYYVQNESYLYAQRILDQHGYCIISGIPGIGKSFLAHMLLIKYVADGYQPVLVRHSMEEAYSLLTSSKKQIFVYDDFLGQTCLETRLPKNEDRSILDFVEYVRRHRSHKFLLTTREYILQQARMVYDSLSAPTLDYAKCVIQLDSYTRKNRAHILFNHLFFSDVPRECIRCMVDGGGLIKVIDHPNYSPRIIEWMANIANLDTQEENYYVAKFLGILDNPRKIWENAFRSHISQASRILLLALFTFQDDTELSSLRTAFESMRVRETAIFGVSRKTGEFEEALHELDGSLINSKRSYNGDTVISFNNPSVRDFLDGHLKQNPSLHLLMIQSLVFYDQVIGLVGKSRRINILDGIGEEHVVDAICRTVWSSARIFKIKNGLGMPTAVNYLQEEPLIHALDSAQSFGSECRRRITKEILLGACHQVRENRLTAEKATRVLRAAGRLKEAEPYSVELADAIKHSFEEYGDDLFDLEVLKAIADFVDCAPAGDYSKLFDTVAGVLDDEQSCFEMFSDCITDCTEEHELDQISEAARRLQETFGIDLCHIDEPISDRQREIEELNDQISVPYSETGKADDVIEAECSDDDIVSMFRGLLE